MKHFDLQKKNTKWKFRVEHPQEGLLTFQLSFNQTLQASRHSRYDPFMLFPTMCSVY